VGVTLWICFLVFIDNFADFKCNTKKRISI
jgi:hypothetical protein